MVSQINDPNPNPNPSIVNAENTFGDDTIDCVGIIVVKESRDMAPTMVYRRVGTENAQKD